MWMVSLGAGVLVVAAVAATELLTWRVSDRAPVLPRGRSCAVIVLGYPSTRSGGLHPMQKWRTRIAVRTLTESGDGHFIFTGGITRRAQESEAAVMARYAVNVLCLAAHSVTLEEQARSTWENVLFSLPLVEASGAERIAIASDPLHAEKARKYLAVQRPDLASRVVRAADYRVLERWWLKVPSAAYYLVLLSRGNLGDPPTGFES